MATIAVLCLLLLERFLASDMDVFTEPVLVGLRALEKSALRFTQSKCCEVLPTLKHYPFYFSVLPFLFASACICHALKRKNILGSRLVELLLSNIPS